MGYLQIKDLTYAKNDQLGRSAEYRKAVFDLYCETADGEKIIIELQKVSQRYFKDRSIYNASFPIQEQGPVGEDWNYQLPKIITIAIMDFRFDDTHPEKLAHYVKLIETKTGEVFYDKLTFVYVEMAKFNKSEAQLSGYFDKWLYLLKNLNKFKEIPVSLQERVFKKIITIAELINLNKEEMTAYEANLKDRRDWKNVVAYAEEQAMQRGLEKGIEKGLERGVQDGLQKGIREGKISVARAMLRKNMSVENMAEITGLSVDEIQNLKN